MCETPVQSSGEVMTEGAECVEASTVDVVM